MALTKLTTVLNKISTLANIITGQATTVKTAFDYDVNVVKDYINDTLTEEMDATFETKDNITTNRKLSATGDFTGTLIGLPIVAADPGLSTIVAGHTVELAETVKSVNGALPDVNGNVVIETGGLGTLLIDATDPPSPLVAVKTDGTDTSTELNTMLTYAKTNKIRTVYVPTNISVASTVLIPLGVELKGAGYNNTAISGLTSGMTVVQLYDNQSALTNVRVVAFGQTGYPVMIKDDNASGVADFVIDGVKMEGGLWELYTEFCWNGVIKNSRLTGGINGLRLGSQSNQIEFDTVAVKCKTAIVYATNASAIKIQNAELTHFEPTASANCFSFDGACHNIEFDTIYMEGHNDTAIFASFGTAGGLSQISFKNIICIPALKYLMNVGNAVGTYPRQISFENCNIELLTALYSYYAIKNFNCTYKNCNFGTIVNAVKEDALTPTYVNAWVNFDANSIVRFWKDSDNNVHVEGIVKSGTAGAIFTLPERYRPSQAYNLTTISGGALARVLFNTDGTVVKILGSNTDLMLDGVMFRAASI